ncbi:MAG: tetratricopeptide repeat protein [Gemmatimonadales bacterium]|jgi:TolB-like protein/Flp pilus assembly protein TadD
MADSSRGYQQFFAELKRRHVFRVMAVYGIVGFIVLQIVDLAVPALLLPDWTYRFVALILLAGFPVAIVLAWAFEQTPDGLKRTARADPSELEAIIAQPASRRWTPGVLALVGAALLFGGWWLGRQGAESPLELGVPAAEAADFQKIAVLPFANVRGDDDSEVLAVSLQEGLAQKLRGLAALRVISTGSVSEYRSTEKGDTQIAGELAAAYLVRGSVLRAAERVQVNVSLIDGESGETIWGDSFDQEISPSNLFEIQSGIAVDVVQEVGTRLSPADVAALNEGPPSDNLAALNAYNRARQAEYSASLRLSNQGAIEWAQRAVSLDSSFVAAWGLLARLVASQTRTGDADRATALDAVRRVEELAPGSADAISARAFYTYYAESKFAAALSQMQEAERLVPSDGDVIAGVAYLHRRLGQLDEAVSAFKRAIEVDPRNVGTLLEYSTTLEALGRFEAADAVAERALQIAPSNPGAQSQKVNLLLVRSGNVGQAKSLAAELGVDPTEYLGSSALVTLAVYDGELDEASRIADQVGELDAVWDSAVRLWKRAWPRILRGDVAPAISDSLLALDLEGANPGFREFADAWGDAARGDGPAAVRSLNEAVKLVEASGDYWTGLGAVAGSIRVKSLLRRVDEALDLLEETADAPGYLSSTELRLDPSFAALRDDPRFEAVVARRQAYEAEQARIAEADRPWLP